MAMGAIFALNAAALYVLHSGRAEKAPLVATIALATTLVWLVLDSGEGLINSIEDQRQYEINIKMISSASELDESGATLMRMPS